VTHGICGPCTARQHWSQPPTIVVASHRADLLPVLEHLLRGDPPIRLVLDRRAGERRRGREETPDTERRRATDRRRRPADAFLV
jgi:hypothetical protein